MAHARIIEPGVAPMDNVSAGEVGGVFAGIMALLYAVGRGIGWVVDKATARIDSRAADLNAEQARLVEWRASLDRREKEAREATAAQFREQQEAADKRFRGLELAVIKLRRRTRAMRECLQEVTTELRVHAPDSAAADRAESVLRSAWAETLDFDVPDDLAELARLLDDDEEDGR